MNDVGAIALVVVLSIVQWVAWDRTYIRRWVPEPHKRVAHCGALAFSVGAALAVVGLMRGEPGPGHWGVMLPIGVPLFIVGGALLTWTGRRRNGAPMNGSSSLPS